jgi:pre-mRNA-processing factor 6
LKSAVFERQRGQSELALKTVTTELSKYPKYPKFAKLYMVQGQIHQAANNFSAARAAYAAGIKAVPKDITLWVLASRLEEADGKSIRARALLEKARLVNPKSDDLWAEAVRVEERSGAPAQGEALLARALQECPTSGILWSMAIWEARPQRKARSVDALRKCEADPLVICTVARLYWADRRIEKAREWFERVVSAGPDLGDAWGWWLKFERQHGAPAQRCRRMSLCDVRLRNQVTVRRGSQSPRMIKTGESPRRKFLSWSLLLCIEHPCPVVILLSM